MSESVVRAQAGWSLESPDDLHYLAIIISHTLNHQSSTVSLSFRLLEQSDSTLLGYILTRIFQKNTSEQFEIECTSM